MSDKVVAAKNCLVIGRDSIASGDESAAIGIGAQALGKKSVAIGHGAIAREDDEVVIEVDDWHAFLQEVRRSIIDGWHQES